MAGTHEPVALAVDKVASRPTDCERHRGLLLENRWTGRAFGGKGGKGFASLYLKPSSRMGECEELTRTMLRMSSVERSALPVKRVFDGVSDGRWKR